MGAMTSFYTAAGSRRNIPYGTGGKETRAKMFCAAMLKCGGVRSLFCCGRIPGTYVRHQMCVIHAVDTAAVSKSALFSHRYGSMVFYWHDGCDLCYETCDAEAILVNEYVG